MHKVICSLPNASSNISGVEFAPNGGDMVATDVPTEDAKKFDGIRGYEIIPPISEVEQEEDSDPAGGGEGGQAGGDTGKGAPSAKGGKTK